MLLEVLSKCFKYRNWNEIFLKKIRKIIVLLVINVVFLWIFYVFESLAQIPTAFRSIALVGIVIIMLEILCILIKWGKVAAGTPKIGPT